MVYKSVKGNFTTALNRFNLNLNYEKISYIVRRKSINKFLKASIIYYFLLGFYLKKIHNTISNYKNISK